MVGPRCHLHLLAPVSRRTWFKACLPHSWGQEHKGVGWARGDAPQSAKGTAQPCTLWPQVPPPKLCTCSPLVLDPVAPQDIPHTKPHHPTQLAQGSTAQPGVTTTTTRSASPADPQILHTMQHGHLLGVWLERAYLLPSLWLSLLEL